MALTALAGALRVAFLDRQSLWVDEALSVVFADRSLPDLLRTLVTEDIHPPLYPLLLHLWFSIAGTSEIAARAPSVLFGILLVPLVYALARALAAPDERVGHWWGIAAATLTAVSPFLVYFAQEARNYSALAFWVTLALASLWRAFQAGGLRWWAAYGLATLAALYTHYGAFLMLAAPPALLLVAWQRFGPALRPWLLTMAAVAIGYAPWLAFGLAQVMRIDDFWPGTIAFGTVVERTWLTFSGGGQGAWVVPAGLLAAVLVTLGLRPLRRTRLQGDRGTLLFLVVHLIVPLVGLYAFVALRPKFNARYLIFMAPLFYLMVARGLVALANPGAGWAGWRPRARRMLAAVFTAALAVQSAAGVFAVYNDPALAKEDYRGLVRYVARNWQPGDVMVLIMDAYQPIVYYGRGQLAYQGLQPYDNQQWAVDRLNEVAERHRRVWLVLWQEDWADPTRYGRHLIEEAGREVPLAVRFQKLGLRLFELPPGTRFRVEPRIDHPAEQRFGDHLLFLGWNGPAEAPAGGTAQYDLHWRALSEPDRDVATTVNVRDTAGRLWAKADCPTGHWFHPPPRWQIDSVIHSQCTVDLPGYLPAGEYRTSANLWDRERAAPVERLSREGPSDDAEQPLGPLRISPREELDAVSAAARLVDRTFSARGQAVLRLRGVEQRPAAARPGATVELTLHWEAVARPPADYAVEVRLAAMPTLRVTASVGIEPTSQWPPGAWRSGKVSLRLPETLAPGEYPLELALRDAAGRPLTANGAEALALGAMRVLPRPAGQTLPPSAQPLGLRFGEVTELLGYELAGDPPAAGGTLRATLYWRARITPQRDYAVLAHLVDDGGRIVAQSDGQPAGGAAPTTTWLPGEVVRDDHVLRIRGDAPGGTYRLVVGLYEEQGGEALAVSDAAGQARGATVEIARTALRPTAGRGRAGS